MQGSFSPIPYRQVYQFLFYRVYRPEQLKYTLVDANTRQDAAQKLEAASHDSYVRKIWVLSPFSTSF
jgi:hypothetical protein